MKNKCLHICIRSFLTVLIFYLFCQKITSQNLVKNPGFEDFVACPETYGSFQEDVLFWKQPTYGSTDYFNTCSSNMPVDENFIGVQEVFEGNAYAGFYAYGPKDYREYISGELKERLSKGKKYTFSFRISLAEKSEYAIKEFGFLFSHKILDLHTERNIPYNLMNRNGLYNYVSITSRNYYDDKNSWTKVSGEYVADGTEKYIILGNFKSNSHTHRSKVAKNLKKAAYYYIDMVRVEETEKPFRLDEIYVLENLLFNVNGYTITGEGEKQLEVLVTHLKENPSLNISFYGHTDNIGSKTHNKELSGKRAKAVGLFLVDNGLSPFRIAWEGFGDKSPVAKNETEEGREKNRRVEFVISKKSRAYYASGVFEDDE